MIDILVTRFGGDQRGDDVVEPLIGAIYVAIARGTAEIDSRAEKMQPVTMEGIYRNGIRRGHLLVCNDSVRGTWVGKIIGITHRSLKGVTKTTLRVLRKTIEPAQSS